MNESSNGIVHGAKATYAAHAPSSNQENTPLRKPDATTSSLRQRSNSNLRTPLTTIQTSRKGVNEAVRPTQSRGGERDQGLSNGSRNGNDSIYTDSYKSHRKKEHVNGVETYDDIPENMYKPEEDLAGWIHREKLAKIESEELQAAGINLAKARSRSRDALGTRLRDSSQDLSARNTANGQREEKRQKTTAILNEENRDETERMNWDFRTPEEIAADEAAERTYASPVLRKSGSKIPVLTSSPTPIPSERYERETPIPRKRTISTSLTPEDSLAASRTRNAGGDGDNAMIGSLNQAGSPSKTRSKSTATSRPGTSQGMKGATATRKVSSPSKPMALSSTPNDGRPGTRGNDTERPKTATNRPEGDPPWLATMYKPDPRLPPEEQLIPTLAKKQMQEQWAANGQIPKTYDRDFNSLEVHDRDDLDKIPQSSPGVEERLLEQQGDLNSWPLKPIPTANKAAQQNRPSTSSGGVTGGYSTMPKVASPPIGFAQSPKIGSLSNEFGKSESGPGPANLTSPASHTASTSYKGQNHRLQHSTDAEDEKLQKKGCCCIVM